MQGITVRVQCEAEDCGALLEVTLPEAPPGPEGQPPVIIVKCGACCRLLEVRLDAEGSAAAADVAGGQSGGPHGPGQPHSRGPDTDPGTGGTGPSGVQSGSMGGHGSTHGTYGTGGQGSSGQGNTGGTQQHGAQPEGGHAGTAHGYGAMAGSHTSHNTTLPPHAAVPGPVHQNQQQGQPQYAQYQGSGLEQHQASHMQPQAQPQHPEQQQWGNQPPVGSARPHQGYGQQPSYGPQGGHTMPPMGQHMGHDHHSMQWAMQDAPMQWNVQQQASDAMQAQGRANEMSQQAMRQGLAGSDSVPMDMSPAAWPNAGHNAALATTRRLQHATSLPAAAGQLNADRSRMGREAAGAGLGPAGGSLHGSGGFGRWGSLTRLLFSSDEYEDVLGVLGIDVPEGADAPLPFVGEGEYGGAVEGHGEGGGAERQQVIGGSGGGSTAMAGQMDHRGAVWGHAMNGTRSPVAGPQHAGLNPHPFQHLHPAGNHTVPSAQYQVNGQSTSASAAATRAAAAAAAAVVASAVVSPRKPLSAHDDHSLPLLPHALPPGVTLQPLRKPRAKKNGGSGGGAAGVLSPYNRFVQQEMKRLREADPKLDHRTALKLAASAWAHYGATLSARLNATRAQLHSQPHSTSPPQAAATTSSSAHAATQPGSSSGAAASMGPSHTHGAAATAAHPPHAPSSLPRPTPSQASALSGSTPHTTLGTRTGNVSPASSPGAATAVGALQQRPAHLSPSHSQAPAPNNAQQQQRQQWQCWSAQYAEGSGPGLPPGMGSLDWGLGLGALGLLGTVPMISSSRDTPLHVALAKQARSGASAGMAAANKVARISNGCVRGGLGVGAPGDGTLGEKKGSSRGFKLPMVPIPEEAGQKCMDGAFSPSSPGGWEEGHGGSCQSQHQNNGNGHHKPGKRHSEESCASVTTCDPRAGAATASQHQNSSGERAPKAAGVPPVVTLPYPFCPDIWHPLLREPVHIPRHLPPDSMCSLLFGSEQPSAMTPTTSSGSPQPSAPLSHSLLSSQVHLSGGSGEPSTLAWHGAQELLPSAWSCTDAATLIAEAAAAAAAAIAAAEALSNSEEDGGGVTTGGGAAAQVLSMQVAGPSEVGHGQRAQQGRRAPVRIPNLSSLVTLLATRVLPML